MPGVRRHWEDAIEAAKCVVEHDKAGEPVVEIVEGETPVNVPDGHRPQPEQY